MQVDKSSFTKAQWEAIAVYVEARKRKRRFYVKAGAAAVLGCSAALMSRSMMDGMPDVPAYLQWVQVALPIALLIVLAIGAAAVHGAVAASRTGLIRSGVPKELVADFEKYPTSKL